jgi:hypothetical protein
MGLYLNVVSGHRKETVGRIVPKVGMLTSKGVIKKVNEKSVSIEGEPGQRPLVSKVEDLTVRLTEARRLGYPTKDSIKLKDATVTVKGQKLTV